MPENSECPSLPKAQNNILSAFWFFFTKQKTVYNHERLRKQQTLTTVKLEEHFSPKRNTENYDEIIKIAANEFSVDQLMY